jgi:hypothetical protein
MDSFRLLSKNKVNVTIILLCNLKKVYLKGIKPLLFTLYIQILTNNNCADIMDARNITNEMLFSDFEIFNNLYIDEEK